MFLLCRLFTVDVTLVFVLDPWWVNFCAIKQFQFQFNLICFHNVKSSHLLKFNSSAFLENLDIIGDRRGPPICDLDLLQGVMAASGSDATSVTSHFETDFSEGLESLSDVDV